jgi:hypothetical protein
MDTTTSDIEAKLLSVQLSLAQGHCTDDTLRSASALISPYILDDIVEDRSISHLCGYPACDSPQMPQPSTSRYEGSVPWTDRVHFCSDWCHKVQ